MNNQDLTKFEFLLTLENNIICQRFFNVRNYNPKSKGALDLYYEVRNICDEISHGLKIKTVDYLHENRDYFYGLGGVETNDENVKEHFSLKIKMGEEVFIERIFLANVFHPKVRYTVDIRPDLKRYLSDLTMILSSKELERTYLNYQL
jgi:hypothetical protein